GTDLRWAVSLVCNALPFEIYEAFKLYNRYGITVCITALAWQMLVCDYCSVVAKFIQTMIQFAHSSYQSQICQTYLFVVFIHALAYILNVTSGRMLPRLQVLAFTVHILGFFGKLIPLSFMPEHREAHEVFAPYISIDPERFPSPAFSWIGGALFYNNLFMGGDCAVHLAEEAERVTAILGPTMIISIFIDGLSAFGITIALLSNKQTVQEIIAGEVLWPEMLFYEMTKSRAATMIMSCVLHLVNSDLYPETEEFRGGIFGKRPIMVYIVYNHRIPPLIPSVEGSNLSLWIHRWFQNQCRESKACVGTIQSSWSLGNLDQFFSVFYDVLILIFSSYPWNSPRSMNLFVRILSMPTGICAIIILSISAYYFAWARHYWKGPIVETSI
ncbi:hypothetical protein N7488_000093, partial [Penicillium malachiteum]